MLRAVLLAVLALCAGALPVRAQERAWPFGVDPRSPRGGFDKLDLYNLGVLGAKAREPGAQLGRLGGGMRRGGGGGASRGGKDLGPEELEIIVLFPGGPCERAQLKPGDVIVGVGKRPFGKEGSLGPIAEAIRKAEASTKRTVPLLVRRKDAEPEARPELVEVRLMGKTARKELARPTRPKARYELGMAALQWLAEKQSGDGGFPETLSGNNGAVVQTCMAGLAWIAGGSDTKSGKHVKQINDAVKFVLRSRSAPNRSPFGTARAGGSNWNQSTWGEAHAAIFLGELAIRSRSGMLRVELQKIVDTLAQHQVGTGGYAHGPGGPNALGYEELNIQTALVLCGLGLAKQAGCEVPQETIEKAAEYIVQSSGGDGGVGYSHKPGQQGMGNIGRTAGCWLGFQALGLDRHPHTAKMRSWTGRHIDEIMDGHASLMQHVWYAGLAAQALGGGAEKKYWAAMERDLVLAQAPDGSFQPRPWHESLSMGSNSDVSFGEVWTTAAWAQVLLGRAPKRSSKAGLNALLGLNKKRR